MSRRIGTDQLPSVIAFMTTPLYAAETPVAGCNPSSWKYCPVLPEIDSLIEFGQVSIQALLGLIGPIALLLLIASGIMYMTAAGNEEKIRRAKMIITGTVAGLGIALIAYSLLVTLSEIMGIR